MTVVAACANGAKPRTSLRLPSVIASRATLCENQSPATPPWWGSRSGPAHRISDTSRPPRGCGAAPSATARALSSPSCIWTHHSHQVSPRIITTNQRRQQLSCQRGAAPMFNHSPRILRAMALSASSSARMASWDDR